jgi:phospholipid/cholesterol/gamma-HCH transport system substrate-binding protein
VPVTVNDVLNTGTRTLAELDSRSLNTIVAELDGVNTQDRHRLSRALTNLTRLAETVNASNPDIKKLLGNGDRILDLARTKDRQLSSLLTNVEVMLAELRQRRAELSTFLGSGDRTVRSMTTLIDKHQADLVAVIADLRTTLGGLRPVTGDFNDLLAWAGPTLSGLAGTGGYGPWLEVLATGLGPLSPRDLAGLAEIAPGARTTSGGRP